MLTLLPFLRFHFETEIYIQVYTITRHATQFYPEDRGSIFIRNLGNTVHIHKEQKANISKYLSRKPKISEVGLTSLNRDRVQYWVTMTTKINFRVP